MRPAAARGDEDGAAAQHNTVLLHRLVSRPSPAVRTQDIMNNATYHQHSFNYNPRRYLVVNDDTNTNTIKTRVRYPGWVLDIFSLCLLRGRNCFQIQNVILRKDTSHLKEFCSHLNGAWLSFGHAGEEITFLTIMLMLTLHLAGNRRNLWYLNLTLHCT